MYPLLAGEASQSKALALPVSFMCKKSIILNKIEYG
jgi:hypothetical protein